MLKNFKLFNLTIANSKLIFDEILKNNTNTLIDLATKIKNTLRIIYQFHRFKKKIIFIGNPLHINRQLSKILKKTKHVFIPRSAWIAGHMTNKKAQSTGSKGKQGNIKLFAIHKLKRKSSLIVIIDQSLDSVALNEFHSLKIPIISLNSDTKMLNETCVIKVPAKLVLLKSNLETFLFYSLLLKILKQGKRKHNFYVKKHLYLAKKTAKERRHLEKLRWIKSRKNFHKNPKKLNKNKNNPNKKLAATDAVKAKKFQKIS